MAKARTQVASADPVPSDRKGRLDEALRKRILSMELAPGAVVDELTLADEFGLSRPPVRELMRQLSAEGYLELEPNRPARVSAMSHHSLRAFFLAAPMLYVATAQLAASNASAAEIARLKTIQLRFRAAIDSGETLERVRENDRFHHEIGLAAHNDYLMPSLRRLLLDHARLGMTFYRDPPSADMAESLVVAVEQHDQIIEAIERHDAEGVGELMRAHMELSRRRMAEYAAPDGMDVPL